MSDELDRTYNAIVALCDSTITNLSDKELNELRERLDKNTSLEENEKEDALAIANILFPF